MPITLLPPHNSLQTAQYGGHDLVSITSEWFPHNVHFVATFRIHFEFIIKKKLGYVQTFTCVNQSVAQLTHYTLCVLHGLQVRAGKTHAGRNHTTNAKNFLGFLSRSPRSCLQNKSNIPEE